MRTIQLTALRQWPKRAVPRKTPTGLGGLVTGAGGNVPSPSTPFTVVDDGGIAVGLYAISGDANSNDSVSNQGGALIVTAPLQLIFWGSAWQTATNPSPGDITSAVQTILSGSFLSQMTQYGYQSVTLHGTTTVISPNPNVNYASGDAGNLIWNMIDQGMFPEPDDTGGRILYMVFMPPGTNLPPGIRGAHADPYDYDFPFDVDYAWVGWVGNGSLDFVTDVFCHELVEAISDPEPNSPAWIMDRTLNGGNEIGDACNNTVDRSNGMLQQAYWSQSHRACAIPYGASLDFDEDSLGSTGRIALAHQASINQLDAVLVDTNGAMRVLWTVEEGSWQGPAQLTAPGFAPPGANVALAHQASMDQLDALVVDSSGAVSVLWAVGGGAWNGPAQLTAAEFAPPGACIALAHQASTNQLNALLVDNTGAISVLWTVGEGIWQGPAPLTGLGFAPPGASVALAYQMTMNQLDAIVVDDTGAVSVLWVVGTGTWQGPAQLTSPGFAPPGAAVALAHQASLNQLNALLVDNDGAVSVLWAVGSGIWQGPAQLTAGEFAPPGANVALGHQGSMNQLDALVVNNSGAVSVLWATGEGAWQGPAQLTAAEFAPPGTSITLAHQASANQLDALLVDDSGAVSVLWVAGGGAWQGPVQLTSPEFAPPLREGVVVASWSVDRLDIFGMGGDLAVYHKAWDGNEWLPSALDWERLGGVFTNPPVVASWGPGRLDVFGRGGDLAVYHKAWNGSAWLPSPLDWDRLGGVFIGPPVVVSWGPNRLDIFGLGGDLAIYHKAWDGNEWLPSALDWERLGGVFTSGPAVASWGPNRLDIFARGTDLAMYHKAWDGNEWLPSVLDWDRLGGVFTSPPAVASWGSNRLDIFGLGGDLAIYHKAWDGVEWLPSVLDWDRLGGVFTSPPTVASWGPNRLDIFGRGGDLAMYHKAWDGNEWLPSVLDFDRLGGVFTSPPAVASWGPNRLDIFGRGSDLATYHKAWDGVEWLPSVLDWERLGGVFV